MLTWTKRFNTFCFLDNHQYQLQPHSLECLLAAGVKREFRLGDGMTIRSFQDFLDEQKTWLFGHLGYDLKNELAFLQSQHPDYIGFPDLFFFEPAVIIRLTTTSLSIDAEQPAVIYEQIFEESEEVATGRSALTVRARFSREEYIHTIRELKKHILRGDCYEINFCQEFFAEHCQIDPLQVYKELSELSPNPFSALYRLHDRWLICASPERYLRKQGNHILSQPIKGTAKRARENPELDEQNKRGLQNSAKDRSENVMVVDLVRNDLAMVCEEGSVKVDELYGVYSFPQVHQMISTISGTLQKEIPFTTILKANFPMGSMTGAPKRSVMQLIEQYEKTKRGIFSGAVGYINPRDDFDFNVVIRSLVYQASTGYLSFQVGSGITFYSDPEQEWDECMMKAEAIKKVLSAK